MKVILLQEVRNVGHKFDVKDVSEGYARNFLFPNKMAELATAGAMKKIAATEASRHKNEADLVKHLEALARKIADLTIEFDLKKGKDGSIFGSVNKEAILKALREHHLITKERIDITLDHPIKELGTHSIPLDLKKGVTTTLKILVKAEG